MQRPKPGETEEDLLKLQSQFLQSESGPSTSSASVSKYSSKRRSQEGEHGGSRADRDRDVVKMEGIESSSSPSTSRPTPSKKSKFQQEKNAEPPPMTIDNDEDVEDIINRKETGLAAVLTNIIERDTRNQVISAPVLSRQAFPTVLRNDNLSLPSVTAGNKKKKKSLFAQHVEARTAKEFGVDRPAACNAATHPSLDIKTDKGLETPGGPCLIDGRGLSASNSSIEAQKIHEENLSKLQSMPESEIMEEKNKLLQSIDPKVLNYLKKRKEEKEAGDPKRFGSSEGVTKDSYSVHKTKKSLQSGKKGPTFAAPIKPEKSWVNMNVVEKDKMEWMKELPPPDSISSETCKSARFDFDGNLLAIDEDIPVHTGLHHHGDEPERAGYSLQELFILARSSNLQQRILSLRTLAKVIQKAKCGELSNKTESPILPVLLDGGLVLLLRWALDDSVEAVVYAALDAIYSLVWSPLDEEAIDSNWTSYLGHLSVTLTPSDTLEKWSQSADVDEENKEEETDGDAIKRDVLEALVKRTHILTRFGYILNSMRPQAPAVVKMLSILCRIAQHSSNLAYEIFKSADLMDKVVKEFLPTAWLVKDPSEPTSDVYGLPVPYALRLVRCLAQTGKNISASLMSKYHLPTVLLRFLAVEAENLHLPITEALNIKKEAIALWRVLASYGLANQTFFDLYETVVHKIAKVGECWSTEHETMGQMAGIVSVMEMVVCSVNRSNSRGTESQGGALSLNWSHVMSLFQPVRSYVQDSLKSIGETYPTQKQDLTLPTACLNFLASFYEVESKQAGMDEGCRLEELEGLSKDCLLPFLSSYGLLLLWEHLCSYSNILASSWSAPAEVTTSMPSLNVVVVESKMEATAGDAGTTKQKNIPVLLPHSPYPFLVSLYRLVLSVCRRHKVLISQLLPPLIDNSDVIMYMKKVCQLTSCPLGSSHWTRVENLLHYFWLKACVLKACSNMTLAHQISLRLLSRLPKGDEYLIHDLMTSVVFSPTFTIEGNDDSHLTTDAMSSLSLSESLYLRSATQEDIDFSKGQLQREAHGSLAAIRGHFLQALGGMEKDVMESRSVHTGIVHGIQRLTSSCDMESLMPLDWTYLPLIHVYNKATTLKSVPGSEITSRDIAMVTSVLQWTYLLETWRPKEIENITPITRLSRVMCAFIAGNEMFLEKGVQKYLAGLFREMTNSKTLAKLNPEENIPGISAFYDLYQEFLEHYESVSFGDPVFGLYVLLPLQQRFDSLYKKAVWGERRKILRTLRVTLKQMLIPIENFLQPEEGDVELINLYCQALVSSSLRKEWSPVLFVIAVHHVNRFLFLSHDDGNAVFRERLWKTVAAHYEMVPTLVYYKDYNASVDDGMESYLVLPKNRQEVFNRHVVASTEDQQTPNT